MNHIFDGSRCIFCGSEQNDCAIYDIECVENREPYTYTTESKGYHG